jgi:hypothetical protein
MQVQHRVGCAPRGASRAPPWALRTRRPVPAVQIRRAGRVRGRFCARGGNGGRRVRCRACGAGRRPAAMERRIRMIRHRSRAVGCFAERVRRRVRILVRHAESGEGSRCQNTRSRIDAGSAPSHCRSGGRRPPPDRRSAQERRRSRRRRAISGTEGSRRAEGEGTPAFDLRSPTPDLLPRENPDGCLPSLATSPSSQRDVVSR